MSHNPVTQFIVTKLVYGKIPFDDAPGIYALAGGHWLRWNGPTIQSRDAAQFHANRRNTYFRDYWSVIVEDQDTTPYAEELRKLPLFTEKVRKQLEKGN